MIAFEGVRPKDALVRQGRRFVVMAVRDDKVLLRYLPEKGIPQDTIWTRRAFEEARFELATS